jgi:hypothetical protein
MRLNYIVMGLIVLTAATCVTPSSGNPAADVTTGNLVGGALDPPALAEQVAFDSGCARERIILIRTEGTTADLDVCGTVRRFKAFAYRAGGSAFTWLDVTSLYPPSWLPAPLPRK